MSGNPPAAPPVPGPANAPGGDGDGDPWTAYFNNDDLNGECFVTGETGEAEAQELSRTVVFTKGMPAATAPFTAVNFTGAQFARFYKENAVAAYTTDATVTVEQAGLIAYLRALGAREGLISPEFSTSSHNVRYNEAVRTDVRGTRVLPNGFYQGIKLSEEVRDRIRKNFADIVSCVAYMFRVRGHHWLEDMDDKYQDLWQKCLKRANDPGLTWKFIAHNALHAVMPDILDGHWKKHAESGSLAGTLVRRIDSAPAGVAAVKAVSAGARDLAVAVPGLRDRYKDHFDELDRMVDKMRDNRWAGSINRRFYGAEPMEFDETKFAAIAAVVIAALGTFAADSPLLKSPSLKRVAVNARITGGIIIRGIATAASDPALAHAVVFGKAKE